MASDGIVPVMEMNPNGGNYGWGSGNGWGALVGGAVGGAVGSAWNGGRWNNGGCCNGGQNHTETIVMDTLSSIGNNVNSIGRDQMLQTAGIQNAMCQGFYGVNSAVNAAAAQAAQNQSRTEAAVLTTGLNGQIQQKDNTIAQLQAAHSAEVQGMRNTFSLEQSISNCCCTTNRNIEVQGCETRQAIHAEGEATRALIAQQEKEQLLRELCSKDAKITQLENQQFTTASLNAQLAAILAKLPASSTPA